MPCLKRNNDSHRGYYLDGVFLKKTIVALNRTVFFPKVPSWLLIGVCTNKQRRVLTPFNFNCRPWEKFLWCSFKNPLMSLTNEIQLLNVNLVYWSRRLRFARSFYFMAETWKGKPVGWKLPRARCLCSAIMRQESPALFMAISANISIKKTSLCPCLPLPREGEDKIVIQWNLTLVKGAGLFSMNKIWC